MATAKHATFRVVSISGASGPVADSAVGGSIDTTVVMLESRPSGRVSPCLAYDQYSCKVVTKFNEPFAPPNLATQIPTDVAFTLLEMDNATTKTVTASGMLPTETHDNFDVHPHVWQLDYAFDAGNTENLHNISVA